MINIENEKPKSKKSFLEKIAPVVLIVLIIFAIWMFKGQFNKNNVINNDSESGQSNEQIEIQALIDFINSESFTSLSFIPDPSIFDQVENVNINIGKDNPLN
ncbi:MAG: hypothetical protein PHU17_00715 [Candidatus Pacebacteria bacterium]|nr:hypothetical protein [Candidatus Paceibacterota bacterium]